MAPAHFTDRVVTSWRVVRGVVAIFGLVAPLLFSAASAVEPKHPCDVFDAARAAIVLGQPSRHASPTRHVPRVKPQGDHTAAGCMYTAGKREEMSVVLDYFVFASPEAAMRAYGELRTPDTALPAGWKVVRGLGDEAHLMRGSLQASVYVRQGHRIVKLDLMGTGLQSLQHQEAMQRTAAELLLALE